MLNHDWKIGEEEEEVVKETEIVQSPKRRRPARKPLSPDDAGQPFPGSFHSATQM
jgi:hypothetical protein